MKKFLLCLMSVLLFGCFEQRVWAETTTNRVVDEADILSQAEEEELEVLLGEISQRQKFDIVVVTVDYLGGKTVEAYADDYYDYNGYGFGEEADGTLLLVDMDSRSWHISTTGFGIRALTDAGLEYISNDFLPYLKNGNYSEAFQRYARLVDRFVTQAKTGIPYDYNNLPKTSAFWWLTGLSSLIVAFVGAYFSMRPQMAQLKTVLSKDDAIDYLDESSFRMTKSEDLLLSRHVSQTRIVRESSSGFSSRSGSRGGSSTHYSSSGRSHGGRSGRF